MTPVPDVRIFLSHSSRDKPFVRRLAADLRVAGIGVWIDEVDIGLGDSLVDRITGGVAAATHVAVVLSRASVASEWVVRELDLALAAQAEHGVDKVVPVLLEDCEVPEALSDVVYVDFREPSAYRQGVRRLLLGLGVPLNDPGMGDLTPDARWYCTWCGWGCPAEETFNDYQCRACGGISLESSVGSMTMAECPECRSWNPLVAAYCRSCGRRADPPG